MCSAAAVSRNSTSSRQAAPGANDNAFLGGFRLWEPDWPSHLHTES